MTSPATILILASLCLCVAVADGLARYAWGRVFGAPALSLLLAAVLANLGLLPGGSTLPPLYAGIFVTVAPMAIFYLLLDAQLRQLRDGVLPMLLAFALGTIGTLLGVLLAATLMQLDSRLEGAGNALAALFAGNLIGSGSDYDALAQRLGLLHHPSLYSAGLAINALVASASVLLACLLPALLQALPRYRHGAWIAGQAHTRHAHAQTHRAHEQLASLGAFALLLVVGLAAFGIAEAGAALLGRLGLALPSVLLIAVLALLVAATGLPARLPGSRALGRFGVCLFMAVLGAHAEWAPLAALGSLGVLLLVFVAGVVAMHVLVLVGIGSGLRLDPDLLAVASQAGLGTASTAMAVAESRQRHDLALPAIIAGSVGNAIGTMSGLLVLRLLGG